IFLLPISVGIAVWFVPERKAARPQHVPMKQAIGALVQSKPLQNVLAADLISGVSGGLVASMFLFLAEDALKLQQYSSLMLLGYFMSGVLFVPLMLWISNRLGKHKTVAWSALFNAVTVPLILIVPEGDPVFAMAVWVLFGVNMAAGPFLFRSIMADVADHDTVQTGQQRTGLFYSMLTMTNKIGIAVAIFGGYAMLDMIGCGPRGANSDEVIWLLKTVYVWAVVGISIIVAVILGSCPIDEEKQRENRAILEQRNLEAAATAIATRAGHPADPQSSGVPAD